jgi:hypothetical protein
LQALKTISNKLAKKGDQSIAQYLKEKLGRAVGEYAISCPRNAIDELGKEEVIKANKCIKRVLSEFGAKYFSLASKLQVLMHIREICHPHQDN